MLRIIAIIVAVLAAVAADAQEPATSPTPPPAKVVAAPGDKSVCVEGQKNVDLNLTSTFNYLDGRIVACFNYSQQLDVENFNRLASKLAAQDAEIAALKARLAKIEAGR